MFEEICLVCGKHLLDDGRAYCSEDCQNTDLSSPSISSSSSAISSPSIGYAAGGDVPALVPSALGSALRVYARRTGCHVSSSSASSNSCSIHTDDEDDSRYGGSECGYSEYSDPINDTRSKSANFVYSLRPSGLSYARRPSETNNHSTVPHLDRGFTSTSSGVRGYPGSAPITTHNTRDDEEGYLDFGFSSGDALDHDELVVYSEKDWGTASKPKYPGAVKSKRSRIRASLPACFSLLQTASPSKDFRASPVSSSSGHTIARPSPPTPKLPLPISQVKITPSIPLPSTHTTPRGRRRVPDDSRSSRRSGHSSASRSRSRPRRIGIASSPHHLNLSQEKISVEEPIDYWALEASELPRRGREAIRRNSSPLPKPFMIEDDDAYALGKAQDVDRSHSRRTRGRARIEELAATGVSIHDAPGLGNGRSGLVDRGRDTGRVPL